MPNPICHVEIPVSDLNLAKEFYEKVFGWKIHFVNDMTYAMADTGHAATAGFRLDVSTPDDTTIVHFIEVESIDETMKLIEQAGGKQQGDKKVFPGTGTKAEFKDPFDNVIGLWQIEKKS